jgi:hypothetical protein
MELLHQERKDESILTKINRRKKLGCWRVGGGDRPWQSLIRKRLV